MPQITAHQAYVQMRSGIAPIVDATATLLKQSAGKTDGPIAPATKQSVEANKPKGFADFVKQYNLKVVDAPQRNGASRGGLLVTATALAGGNANHPLMKAATLLHDQTIQFSKILKEQFKRDFSPGYIRGEAKTEAPVSK